MKPEPGQLRRWQYQYSSDESPFIVLDRVSPEFVDSKGGSIGTPAWSILSYGVWDWMYEVDLEEMSEVL